MNPECRFSSMHASPRPQQSRSPEYAAAGDAPRGQISPVRSLPLPPEIFAMNNTLLTTVTKNDSKAKRRLNDPRAQPSVGRSWNFSNDASSSSFITRISDAKFAEKNDEESIFTLKPHTIESNLDCHVSLDTEPPCRESSYATPQDRNNENLVHGERTALEHSELPEIIATNEKGDLRIRNEDYRVDEILSPNRKTSMFSKEIWTEKVLPIDTLVCPEPEIVEIYIDRSRMNSQLEPFGDDGTDFIYSSTTRESGNRGKLGRRILRNPPSSARKGRMTSLGQKTIDFDNEIWSVCPKLIPSGKELAISILENSPHAVSPERLNNEEEVPHCQSSSLNVTSILEVSSKMSPKQYDPKGSSGSEKVIESFVEIMGQDYSSSTSAAGKFRENEYLQSTISLENITTVEKLQRFDEIERSFCETSPVKNILDHTECNNFPIEPPAFEALSEPGQRLTQVKHRKQEMRKSGQSSQSRTLKKNPLSVSNGEPVSTILRDILTRREIDSPHKTKLSPLNCNGIKSLDEVRAKKSQESFGSSLQSLPAAETVKQVSFTSVKSHEMVQDHFEEIFHTRENIVCKVPRKMDEPFQSSANDCPNKMLEMNLEFSSNDQNTCRDVHVAENHFRTSDTTPSPAKLPAADSRNVEESITEQDNVENRKRVKMVRFKTCDKHDDTGFNKRSKKLSKNCVDRDIEAAHCSKVHSDFAYTNDTPDCISVESLRQEIDHLADQISRQITPDSALDDAVATLARVELIVEANRQTVEKLQQQQPNITIQRLAPPDAGKSLAKALMRCRNYLQNNGYSHDATGIINELLGSTVRNLKQLVERQKLALAVRSKTCYAIPAEGQRESKNIQEVLIPEEFGADQVQFLISDILVLTEEIVPQLNEKEFLVAPTPSHNGVKNSTKNKEAISHIVLHETNDASSSIESNVTSKPRASSLAPPFCSPYPKVKEAVKTCLEEPVMSSGVYTNPRADNEEQSIYLRGHQRADTMVENMPVARSTHSKKKVTSESTKTLKKMFNGVLDKRSKTLPRHYNVNDSIDGFQSRTSSYYSTINQKLPVWKPGGNNFSQPSMSATLNHRKICPSQLSSINKKKTTTSERTRDKKLHQRTKGITGIIQDRSTILEKTVIKPYNTTSLAKIRTIPAKEHYSEVLSLDRSKVQVAAELDENRTRKPRSKSRTRTKTLNTISRMEITEIPLEHADGCLTVTEQKPLIAKEFLLSRKASSSPKDIIQMLKELIKSSSNETCSPITPPVQVVTRCDVTVKGASKDVDRSAPSETNIKLINETNSSLSNKRGDYRAEEPSDHMTIQAKSIEEIVDAYEDTAEISDKKIPTDNEEVFIQDTLAKSDSLHNELDSTSVSNMEKICTVSRSNSEATSNHSSEQQTTQSVSNVGCTAELSSEHSIGSIFSKCCQASLTSITSHEISEELLSSQMSEIGVTSCCEETQKDSNESFNIVEEDEVTQKHFTQQFHEDQSVSANSETVPRRKFANRHARSLEMLREILSDQGLGIDFLSRAESELQHRCKCSSNKKGLTVRRSLQSANSTNSRFSVELVNGVTLPERNHSNTLVRKLATLSESESDIERVEAATMTAANNSTMSTNDCSTSAGFDYHYSKEDEALQDKVVTVETATQFDVTAKSDICVGAEIICNTYLPLITKHRENPADNFCPLYTSSVIYSPTNLPYVLPDEVLDAFRLAAIRASNLYTAVNILRENMPSETISGSNSASKSNANEIVIHSATPLLLSAAENPLDTDKIKKGPVHYQNTAFSPVGDAKSPAKTEESKTSPPLTVITPKIRATMNDRENGSEPTKRSVKKLPKKLEINTNITAPKKADENTVRNRLKRAYNPGSVKLNNPVVLSKPFFSKKPTFSMPAERRTVVKELIIDLSQVPTIESKSSCDTDILQSGVFLEKKSYQSPLPSQQDLGERCQSEKQVKMLHFAGRQSASVVKKTATAELKNITDLKPKSSNASIASYKSPKASQEIKDSFASSRIKTLLEANLQLFKLDHCPIIDEKVFTDFGDQFSTESNDDEVLIDKEFPGTTTPTSCMHVDDAKIFSEVEHLLNYLLNKIDESCESSTMAEQYNPNTHQPRQHHLRKRFKSERRNRTNKKSVLCSNNWNNLGRVIVSREHLLSLIYAAICSFVFCCLQLSVYCEF